MTPDEAIASAKKICEFRDILAAGIPGEPLYGYVPLAGVTKNYVPATRG